MSACFCHRPDRNCEKCRSEAGLSTYSIDTRSDAERERDRRMQADAVVTVSPMQEVRLLWDGHCLVNLAATFWDEVLREVLTDRADLLEDLAVN